MVSFDLDYFTIRCDRIISIRAGRRFLETVMLNAYELAIVTKYKQHYLWRAVDHEGEVLESYVTKRRDRKSAL